MVIEQQSIPDNQIEGGLGRLLVRARRRVDPVARSLGPFLRLPARIGKPVTQEEVAEAADISRNWYLRLETVQGVRISPALLDRIAKVLMLNPGERAEMFQLALPELRPATLKAPSPDLLEALRPLRELARRLSSVSSLEDAAAAAVETVQGVLSPSCISGVTFLPNRQRRFIASGPMAQVAGLTFAEYCLKTAYATRFGHTLFNESRPGCVSDASPARPFMYQQRTADGGGVSAPL